MDFREYQARSRESAAYGNAGLQYAIFGLASEAGEVSDIIKRRMRQAQRADAKPSPADIEAFIDELGDVLWYVAACCHELHIDMEFVASNNLQKLLGRKEGGKILDRLGELTER